MSCTRWFASVFNHGYITTLEQYYIKRIMVKLMKTCDLKYFSSEMRFILHGSLSWLRSAITAGPIFGTSSNSSN